MSLPPFQVKLVHPNQDYHATWEQVNFEGRFQISLSKSLTMWLGSQDPFMEKFCIYLTQSGWVQWNSLLGKWVQDCSHLISTSFQSLSSPSSFTQVAHFLLLFMASPGYLWGLPWPLNWFGFSKSLLTQEEVMLKGKISKLGEQHGLKIACAEASKSGDTRDRVGYNRVGRV